MSCQALDQEAGSQMWRSCMWKYVLLVYKRLMGMVIHIVLI